MMMSLNAAGGRTAKSEAIEKSMVRQWQLRMKKTGRGTAPVTGHIQRCAQLRPQKT